MSDSPDQPCLEAGGSLDWDDELGALLDQKAVAMKDIQAQLGRRFDVDDFLAARCSGAETAT